MGAREMKDGNIEFVIRIRTIRSGDSIKIEDEGTLSTNISEKTSYLLIMDAIMRQIEGRGDQISVRKYGEE